MRYRVQFTARKRDAETGEPCRWYHGPFRSRADAVAGAEAARKSAAKAKRPFDREVKIEILPYGLRASVPRGRPLTFVDVARARELVGDGLSLRAAAERMKVPRSTLRDALRRTPPPRPPRVTGGRKRRSKVRKPRSK